MGDRAFTYYNNPHLPQGRVAVCRKTWCNEPVVDEDLCGIHLMEQESLRAKHYRDPQTEARAERETNPKKLARKV